MNEKPRVLLSAYQCGPGMGSVSQIGWEWYSRLTRHAEVTLATHVRNRDALERAGAPVGDSSIHFVDTEWFAGPLYRTAERLFPRSEHNVFLLSSLDFFVFDRSLVRWALGQARSGHGWDLAHQVTPVSTVAPTRLPRIGAPVVLGPLNAGLGTLSTFPEIMRQESGWLIPLRFVGRGLDVVLGSMRSVHTILTATRSTLVDIPAGHRARCMMMIENGVDLARFVPFPWPEPPVDGRPLRVLFVGRMIAVKGVSMLLDAAARLRERVPLEVRLVGDGPMRAAWTARAAQLGLLDDGTVRFEGASSLDEVAEQTRWCHVFCLPSVRESGGAVLLEAMASSRPVVAIDFGGPGEIVDEGVGRLLDPIDAESVVDQLVDTLSDVARRPQEWRRRGEEGRRRVERLYAWESKVAQAAALYDEILGRAHERPHQHGAEDGLEGSAEEMFAGVGAASGEEAQR